MFRQPHLSEATKFGHLGTFIVCDGCGVVIDYVKQHDIIDYLTPHSHLCWRCVAAAESITETASIRDQ